MTREELKEYGVKVRNTARYTDAKGSCPLLFQLLREGGHHGEELPRSCDGGAKARRRRRAL
jgi:hypothetical protein